MSLKARKFLLIQKIRRAIQHFLRVQHENTKTFTLGPLDFDHDLQILGMSLSPMQQPSKLSYRIENGSDMLDEILAPNWDLNRVENGFRIITSLDIKTTTNFEISFIAQAATCPEEIDLEDYRHQYLRYSASLQASLALDSFQTPSMTSRHPESHELTVNTSTLETPLSNRSG